MPDIAWLRGVVSAFWHWLDVERWSNTTARAKGQGRPSPGDAITARAASRRSVGLWRELEDRFGENRRRTANLRICGMMVWQNRRTLGGYACFDGHLGLEVYYFPKWQSLIWQYRDPQVEMTLKTRITPKGTPVAYSQLGSLPVVFLTAGR